MAFNSGKCVSCTEPTRRNVSKYHGKDEKGNYSGPMYVCDNTSCSINYERRKLHKQVIATQERKLQEDTIRLPHDSSLKHGRNKRRK